MVENNFKRRDFVLGGLGALSLVLAGCSPDKGNTSVPSRAPEITTQPPLKEGNLLSAKQWEFMPGATPEAGGVRIKHTGRALVEQDGSEGQVNRPINLYGPRLDVQGNFSISANLTEIKKSGVVHLYSEPPRVYDEARYDGPGIRMNFEDGKLYIDAWDRFSQEPAVETEFAVPQKDEYDLTLKRKDGMLDFVVDGESVGAIPDAGVFDNGQVWFGADSDTKGGSFLLTNLQAEALEGGKVDVVDVPSMMVGKKNPEGFQELANQTYRGKKIGAAVSLGPLAGDKEYRDLALGWYGQWTIENALKPQFVHPSEGVYTFGEVDAILAIAQKNGIDVHAHTLNFGEANPQWMQDAPVEEREKILKDHIRTVGEHLNGRVKTVDVVNEPLHEDFFDGPLQLREHLWHEAMGKRHIEVSLQEARKAMPDALLGINEWGLEADGARWNGMLTLVEDLLKKDVPLDYIGFQGHVYESGDEIDAKTLSKHFRQIASLGEKYGRDLKVRVSELDVYGRNTENQTSQFADVVKVCMEEPKALGMTMWGISEKYGSTYSGYDEEGKLQAGDGLPFDEQNQPLKAVSAMQTVLRS